MEIPIVRRRTTRLTDYDYSRSGGYFVTICTHHRNCLFAEIVDGKAILNEFGKIVESRWWDLPNRYPGVEIDQFVIMPNHLHGILIINEYSVGAIHELPLQQRKGSPEIQMRKNRRKMLLPKIIGFLKMNSAKEINEIRKTSGQPVWQRNYYEHVIRNEKDLARIYEYIENNPLQWHLDEENPKFLKNFMPTGENAPTRRRGNS